VRLCAAHGDQLDMSLAAAGLESLAAETHAETMARLVDRSQHGVTVDNFDPWFMARVAIFTTAARACWPITAEPPQTCPICWLGETHAKVGDHECPLHEDLYERWIGDAAYAMLETWQELRA
jgi:hypothetical protein